MKKFIYNSAHVAIAATTLFLILLATLHFLKPEISPLWRVISEYEIGRFGWLMQIAFFSLAVGSLTLFLALKSHIRTISGYVGLLLLFVTVIGITIGAIFPSDPITTSRNEWSETGKMHNLGGYLSVILFPLVTTLISNSLWRNQKWIGLRSILLFLNIMIWFSLVSYFLVYYLGGGVVGPDTLIGIPNRIFIFSYSIWIILVAIWTIKLKDEKQNNLAN